MDEYVENKALVFEDLDFLGVWAKIMKKDYEKLADHVVNLGGMWESREEVIQVMKDRTKRFSKEDWA